MTAKRQFLLFLNRIPFRGGKIMARFRLSDESMKLETHVNGISVAGQNMLPGFQTRKDIKLSWAGYFEPLEVDATFSLVLNPSEAFNLATRIFQMLGETNERQ